MICVGILLMWIVMVTAAAAVAAATLMELMAVATAEDGSVDAVLSRSASGYFGVAAVGRGGSVDAVLSLPAYGRFGLAAVGRNEVATTICVGALSKGTAVADCPRSAAAVNDI